MNFIPSKGDFFYVTYKPRLRIIGGDMFGNVAEKVVEQTDGSYSGEVFTCIGRDNHALVATKKGGPSPSYTFVLSKVTFTPVGPEVLQALCLIAKETA